MSVDTFTSSTTWTCPAGVTSVQVECWAGGAGGGCVYGAVSFGNSANAGGGGAYSKLNTYSVTPGNNYTVTVGTGGAGGDAAGAVNGQPGGDSWFSTSGTVLAKGGTGGQSNIGSTHNFVTSAGGAAASGIGDVKYSGGVGGYGCTLAAPTHLTSGSGAAGGGAGSTGDGGAGGNGTPNTDGTTGTGTSVGGGNGGVGSTAGSTYGGGGSGPVDDFNTGSPKNGYAGYAGAVQLTYTASSSSSGNFLMFMN